MPEVDAEKQPPTLLSQRYATLATIRDLVLGANAPDQSDEALLSAIANLVGLHPEIPIRRAIQQNKPAGPWRCYLSGDNVVMDRLLDGHRVALLEKAIKVFDPDANCWTSGPNTEQDLDGALLLGPVLLWADQKLRSLGYCLTEDKISD